MTRACPRPFLKWAGGKRALMPEILDRLPDGPIDLYVEPFLGGGAVFLELARQGRIGRAVLNDRNAELVHVWRTVQSSPGELVEAVMQWPVSATVYYHVRDDLTPSALDDITRAARVLWLNRTCYNGKYRKNKRGRFNTPFGKNTAVTLVDPENIHAVSEALAGVQLLDVDFEAVMGMAGAGAVVYCDPPYVPVSKTSSFNRYDGKSFDAGAQRRLAEAFVELRGRGAFGLLSNAWTDFTRDLYAGHGLVLDQVKAPRNINSKASKRGPVPEIMVATRHWRAA